jgi:hypothetical protein
MLEVTNFLVVNRKNIKLKVYWEGAVVVIRRLNKFTFNKRQQKYFWRTKTFQRFYEKLNKYMEIEPPSRSKRKCHIL